MTVAKNDRELPVLAMDSRGSAAKNTCSLTAVMGWLEALLLFADAEPRLVSSRYAIQSQRRGQLSTNHPVTPEQSIDRCQRPQKNVRVQSRKC